MKKVLATLLSIALLMVCVPLGAISVSAATSGTTGDCTWTLEDGHLTISGEGEMGNYSTRYVFYEYYTTAPWGQSNITSVTIEDGVTTIGDYAFYHCTSFRSMTIGDSVTTIGECAFVACSSLTSITIPDSVTTIIDYATFSGCTSLTAIAVDENHPNYCSLDGILFNKEKTELIVCPQGKSASYGIPDGVTTIGECAFLGNTKLTSVTIPDSVTTIGRAAFACCESLTSVTIPDGVTTIEGQTFYQCDSLKSVIIGDGVTTIKWIAFEYCTSLKTVTIGNSVTTIAKEAFYFCNTLTDVHYHGTEQNQAAISIGSSNSDLTDATWHYYDDKYDADCSLCGIIREVPEKPVDITYGDVSGDGEINARDLVLLQQFMVDWDVTIDEVAADVNASGDINARDVALLQQYIAGWDVQLGK